MRINVQNYSPTEDPWSGGIMDIFKSNLFQCANQCDTGLNLFCIDLPRT